MRTKFVVGLVLSIIGIVMVVYAGYIFNELFFKTGLTRLEDMPIYSQHVIPSILIGLLGFIDGLAIMGLKKSYALSVYLIFNVVWIYSTLLLIQYSSIPILKASEYEQVFYLFFLAFIILLVGVLVNNFPKQT
ncbi:MAG: hypothetical protein QW265_04385 [Candidatus Bathyarchaeia archaeon]